MLPFRSSVYVTEMGESFRCAIIQSSLYVYWSVCLFVCLSVRLFVCSSVCLFVCSSVCLFVCSSVRLFVCSSVRLFVCLSVRLFVCFDSPMCHQSVKIFSHTQKNIFSFVNQIRLEKLSTKIVIYYIWRRKAQLNLTFSVKRKYSFFSLKSSMFKLKKIWIRSNVNNILSFSVPSVLNTMK